MAGARNTLQMRRLLSVLSHHNQSSFSPVIESTQQGSTIFTRSDFNRRFQTQTSAAVRRSEESEDHETNNLKHGSDSANVPSQISSSENCGVKHSATSSLKISPRHDLAMIFTCTVCETRSVKTTCRESYEKGVVVARCDGCNNLHLMADRLGWFGEPGSIEDFLAARGEDVKKGSEDTLSLTLEDLAGSVAFSAARMLSVIGVGGVGKKKINIWLVSHKPIHTDALHSRLLLCFLHFLKMEGSGLSKVAEDVEKRKAGFLRIARLDSPSTCESMFSMLSVPKVMRWSDLLNAEEGDNDFNTRHMGSNDPMVF